jgi:hypothetical protein
LNKPWPSLTAACQPLGVGRGLCLLFTYRPSFTREDTLQNTLLKRALPNGESLTQNIKLIINIIKKDRAQKKLLLAYNTIIIHVVTSKIFFKTKNSLASIRIIYTLHISIFNSGWPKLNMKAIFFNTQVLFYLIF